MRRDGNTEYLQIVGIKSRSLIKVLQEAARRCDKNVHFCKSVAFVLEVLSSNNETGGKRMVPSDGAENIENLNRLENEQIWVLRT